MTNKQPKSLDKVMRDAKKLADSLPNWLKSVSTADQRVNR